METLQERAKEEGGRTPLWVSDRDGLLARGWRDGETSERDGEGMREEEEEPSPPRCISYSVCQQRLCMIALKVDLAERNVQWFRGGLVF